MKRTYIIFCSALTLQLLLCPILLFPYPLITSGNITRTSTPKYQYTGMFNNPGKKLKKLIKEKQYRYAAALYISERPYFIKKEKKYSEDLFKIASAINEIERPKIVKVLSSLNELHWPTNSDNWKNIRTILITANRTISDYNEVTMLKEEKYRSLEVEQLLSKYNSLRSLIIKDATREFTQFDHFRDISFFYIYPVKFLKVEFMNKHMPYIKDKLSAASANQIISFVSIYPQYSVLSTTQFREVSNIYLHKLINESGGIRHMDFTSIMDIVAKAYDEGFAPSNTNELELGLVVIDNQKLSEQHSMQYNIDINNDLPFNISQLSFQEILTLNAAEPIKHVIVVNIVKKQCDREVTEKKKHLSKYLAETIYVNNPEYQKASIEYENSQNLLYMAQEEYNRASQRTDYSSPASTAALLAYALGVKNKREAAEKAGARLASTPVTIEKEIYDNYEYNTVEYKVTKKISLECYYVDMDNESYFERIISLQKENQFTQCYNIHVNDPSRTQLIETSTSDDDIEQWEKINVSINLSEITKEFVSREEQDIETFPVEQLSSDLSRHQEERKSYSEGQYGHQEDNSNYDQIMDSVVVVENPQGWAGAGFYVKDNIVITNYHIVEGGKYIEIRKSNGAQTTGKVIYTNPCVDVALLEVGKSGKPVIFCSKKRLQVGCTVEAIGHPKGLEYSFTRGVLSAIRKMESSSDYSICDVLFIQTDTAINRGNSGGPLLINGEVVGMNTQKMVMTDVEGLGFAIHYSELLTVMKQAGIYVH